jgi:ribosomal protein L19E
LLIRLDRRHLGASGGYERGSNRGHERAKETDNEALPEEIAAERAELKKMRKDGGVDEFGWPER